MLNSSSSAPPTSVQLTHITVARQMPVNNKTSTSARRVFLTWTLECAAQRGHVQKRPQEAATGLRRGQGGQVHTYQELDYMQGGDHVRRIGTLWCLLPYRHHAGR
ncbi:hypothetical protein ACOMHN_031274 [Nucella lapillus]